MSQCAVASGICMFLYVIWSECAAVSPPLLSGSWTGMIPKTREFMPARPDSETGRMTTPTLNLLVTT